MCLISFLFREIVPLPAPESRLNPSMGFRQHSRHVPGVLPGVWV